MDSFCKPITSAHRKSGSNCTSKLTGTQGSRLLGSRQSRDEGGCWRGTKLELARAIPRRGLSRLAFARAWLASDLGDKPEKLELKIEQANKTGCDTTVWLSRR
jgi:hypothetical protein